MTMNAFNLFLGIMSLIALIVFIALYFVKAGYGIFRTASWGVAISNKLAWILMEAPVFLVMCWMWVHSERRFDPVILMFFIFFQIHYFQRAFVFPLLLTGKSKMPLAIMSMGILFNLLNGYMQGQWIFHLAPEGMYGIDWFMSPWFILGTLLFFTGMLVNWHSDYIIRHLRKPPLSASKRDVPLRYFRQLLRRNSRVGRLGDTHLFTFRTCVSLVDDR